MSAETLLDHIIPAKEFFSFELLKGQILRVIDVEGKQVVDLVAINSANKNEKLSCAYSNMLNGTWKLTRDHILYSNLTNPIFTIIADQVGLHYTGGGFCTEAMNYTRFKEHGTRNCADNLTKAFSSYNIKRNDFDFDCCFNIFMNLTYQADGSIKLDEPLSKPGDCIDMRAEMDSIVAISNCPQDRNPCNAFNPSPIKVQVLSPKIS